MDWANCADFLGVIILGVFNKLLGAVKAGFGRIKAKPAALIPADKMLTKTSAHEQCCSLQRL